MAYATVAGLPVAVGLYTAFVPMLIYALLGSSRVLSVSSTTTLAILAGTQLGLVVPDGDPAQPGVALVTGRDLVMAEGSAHLYPRFGPTMLWDTGAGHVIAKVAGAQVEYQGIANPAYHRENLKNPNFLGTFTKITFLTLQP